MNEGIPRNNLRLGGGGGGVGVVILSTLFFAELQSIILDSGHYTGCKENMYIVQNVYPLLEGTYKLPHYLHVHQWDNYSSFT